MIKSVFIIAALTTCVFASPAMAVAVTPGDYTFNFTGICTDCVGPGIATLKLTNYVLGSSFDASQVSSFSYNGSDKFPAYSSRRINWAGGSINNTPGSYDIHLVDGSSSLGYGTYFVTKRDGSWDTGEDQSADQGIAGTWSLETVTAVPEPATWALTIGGFGMIGGTMRRTRKAGVTVSCAWSVQ